MNFVFFVGKQKRCKRLVTLTASVYHPLLSKQVALATMEPEGENSVCVALFWQLFTKMLKQVSGNSSVMFNPVGWCTDMAGANLRGLTDAFRAHVVERIKSCEFHLKDHRNKKAQTLDSDSADVCKEICDELLNSLIPEANLRAKQRMDKFIAASEDRKFLEPWISWWHDRRGFILRALAPKDAPQMNQAEVRDCAIIIRRGGG